MHLRLKTERPESNPVMSAAASVARKPQNLQKKSLSPESDPHEKEADAVAREVVSGGHEGPPPAQLSTGAPALQKKPVSRITPVVQRQEAEIQEKCASCEAEEGIQRKEKSPKPPAKGADFHHKLRQRKQAGNPLPPDVQAEMEAGFGTGFSEVRIHTDTPAAELNTEANARAFTTGRHIFFGQNAFNPATREGKELLAHELTHTLQQEGEERRKPADKKPVALHRNLPPPTLTERPLLAVQPVYFPSTDFRSTQAEKPAAQPELQAARQPAPESGTEMNTASESPATEVTRLPAVGFPKQTEVNTSARAEASAFVTTYQSELQTILRTGGETAQAMDATQADICGIAAEKAARLGQNMAATPGAESEAAAAAAAEKIPDEWGLTEARADQMYSVMDVMKMVGNMKDGPIKQQVRAYLNAILPTKPEEIASFTTQGISGGLINAGIQRLRELQGSAGSIEAEVEPEPVPQAQGLRGLPEAQVTAALNLGKDAIPAIPQGAAELRVYLTMLDKVLLQEGVKLEELASSDVPVYKQVYEIRQMLLARAEAAPGLADNLAAEARKGLQHNMDGAEKESRNAMLDDRKRLLGEARGDQLKSIRKQEAERQRIRMQVDSFHQEAQVYVRNQLQSLERRGEERFNKRVLSAGQEMDIAVNRRREEYRDESYEKGGFWSDVGFFLEDKLVGLDGTDAMKTVYQEERQVYLDKIDAEVTALAEEGNRVLADCRRVMAQAKEKAFRYLSGLSKTHQDLGLELARQLASRFDALEETIQQRQQALSDKLCKQREAAVEAIDRRIEKMKEESAGLLIQGLNLALDALVAPFRWALEAVGYDMTDIDDVINRVKRTFTYILQHPVDFVKGLIGGVGEGFENFAKNIRQHLLTTLFSWLTGSLSGQGVSIPEEWNLSGILQFIGSLVGIGADYVMELVRAAIPPKVMEMAEKTMPVLMDIWEQGPGALWEYMMREAEALKDMAIEGLRNAVITQLVMVGVKKLISAITLGAGAFMEAVQGLYKIVMWFKKNWEKIADLVTKVFNTFSAIADGNLGEAATGVEMTMARGLTTVFSFFMSAFGLDGIVGSAMEVFRNLGARLREAVKTAVLRLVAFIKDKFKALFGKPGAAGGGEGEEDQTENKIDELDTVKKTFHEEDDSGPLHTIRFVKIDGVHHLRVFSEGREIREFLRELVSKMPVIEEDTEKRELHDEGLKIEEEVTEKIRDEFILQKEFNDIVAMINRLQWILSTLSRPNSVLPVPEYEFKVDSENRARYARAWGVSARTATGTTPGNAWVKGWTHLQKDLTTGGGKWVRMHLINEKKFGGVGFNGNLVPGPHALNQDHKNEWETPIANLIGGKTRRGPSNETMNVFWLRAEVKYHEEQEFPEPHEPPYLENEREPLPAPNWFASEMQFSSGFLKEVNQKWVKDESRSSEQIDDLTLSIPLPDWSLARVPPINTGDRSEFQAKASNNDIVKEDEAKKIFKDAYMWSRLNKRRKQKPFESLEEVMSFLRKSHAEKPAQYGEDFIIVFEKMIRDGFIRLNG